MINLDTTRILAAQGKVLADAVEKHAQVLAYCQGLPNPESDKISDDLSVHWSWGSSTSKTGYDILRLEVQKRFRAELNNHIYAVADQYRKAADQALVDLKTMIETMIANSHA